MCHLGYFGMLHWWYYSIYLNCYSNPHAFFKVQTIEQTSISQICWTWSRFKIYLLKYTLPNPHQPTSSTPRYFFAHNRAYRAHCSVCALYSYFWLWLKQETSDSLLKLANQERRTVGRGKDRSCCVFPGLLWLAGRKTSLALLAAGLSPKMFLYTCLQVYRESRWEMHLRMWKLLL